MRMLRNKKNVQKMIISLIILILFNFIFPVYSNAYGFIGGGVIFDPIMNLICGIGDNVLNILQSFFLPYSPSAINYESINELVRDKIERLERLLEAQQTELSARIENYDDGENGQSDASKQSELQSLIEKQRKIEEQLEKIKNLDLASDLFLRQPSEFDGGFIYNSFYSWVEGFGDNTKKYIVPCILFSPASIFSNTIPALDINFINPSVAFGGADYRVNFNGDKSRMEVDEIEIIPGEVNNSNSANVLQTTVSTWYKALRNISIVALLSVLIYIAIRIIISSTAGETAKYKSMLKDWFIALCLLFFMHYAMAFLLKCTEMITSFLVDSPSSGFSTGVDTFFAEIRYRALEAGDETKFGYTLMYIIMVFYTIMFTYKYVKRLIYLAFLTMISPLVALTYPIDKLKDGSAQAFNKWFKEYVFNVLIQPIHLLLYCMLITSAINLAETNMVYAVIALAFILEAEKIIKDLFGIQTQRGEASGAITGGVMFGASAGLVKNGLGLLPGSNSDSKKSEGSNNGKVNFTDRKADKDASKNLNSFKDGSENDDNSEGSSEGGLPVGGSSAGGSPTGGSSAGGSPTGGSPTGGSPTGRAPNAPTPNRTRNSNGTANSGTSGKYGYERIKDSIKNGLSERFPTISKIARNVSKKPAIKGVKKVAGKFINKDNAKKVAKLLAKGAGAVTLGTIGLAAGLASDNDGDILKYAGLGMGVGALAGGKAFDTGMALKDGTKNTVDTFQKGYYGDEYEDKVLNPRLDKQWYHDKDVREYYQNKYGDDWKQKMDESLEYRKAGITDQSDIDAAIKLRKENPELDGSQVADIMTFSKDLSKSDFLSADKWDNVRESAYDLVKDDEKVEKIMGYLNQRFGYTNEYRPKSKKNNANNNENNANNNENNQSEQQFEDGAGI